MTGRRAFLLGLLLVTALGAVGVSFAAFTSTTSNAGSTFGAKRVFPGVRSVSANDIRDASAGGAEVNASDPFAAAGSITVNTSAWSNAFAANRYVEWDLNGPLPSGLAVSSPQFNFRWAASGAGRTACFYVEVYRRATSTLIGTHGSAGTPFGCVTGTAQTTFNVPIAEVSTTTIADDLRVRVYGRESTNRGTPIDLATVTGSTPYTAFTLNETVFRDRADTTVATTLWSIAAADAANYLSAATWAVNFSNARYLTFTTSLFAPTGATVTNATFTYSYRPNTNGNTNCWYFATYNGTTLLATHGSPAAPISCDSTSANFTTNTVAIPEVTAADLNNLVVRAYHRDSGGGRSRTDFIRIDADYYYD
ncbi:MAG TPA: hypothetical protein VHH57_11495 [Gaiella sp.]|nr:hypothetical protein [Gaiella sp.]